MSQYAMRESFSQEDRALAEQVAQQLQRFVQPFLELLDAYVPRDTQRVSQEGEKALKNWQRRQECVILRENE